MQKQVHVAKLRVLQVRGWQMHSCAEASAAVQRVAERHQQPKCSKIAQIEKDTQHANVSAEMVRREAPAVSADKSPVVSADKSPAVSADKSHERRQEPCSERRQEP